MSFASDTGYLPVTIEQSMEQFRLGVNEQFGTTYDTETFKGTNFYKYFYAIAQRVQENEIKTSEIFEKMEQYFSVTNEKITRPNTTHPGVIDYIQARGYRASTKKPLDADAGKAFVCVQVDNAAPDYAARKLAICTMIKNCIVAGCVSQGTESTSITLPNNQSFDFKFYLPTKIPVKLKVTLVLSANNQFTVLSDQEVREKLYANIMARYRLGLNFEPQRYFSVVDAPWAASVLVQYSTDGGTTWVSTVYSADFKDLFTFAVSDISVVTT